jgi:hypothetical protein
MSFDGDKPYSTHSTLQEPSQTAPQNQDQGKVVFKKQVFQKISLDIEDKQVQVLEAMPMPDWDFKSPFSYASYYGS